MKLPFKFKSNPQAFRASLFLTFTAFALNFISNTNPENEVSFLQTFFYFLLGHSEIITYNNNTAR